jgi:hypothetical protein
MCSNYRPVTRSDQLQTFFGVERERDEVHVDAWPLGLAPFIRVAEDGSGNKIIDDACSVCCRTLQRSWPPGGEPTTPGLKRLRIGKFSTVLGKRLETVNSAASPGKVNPSTTRMWLAPLLAQ